MEDDFSQVKNGSETESVALISRTSNVSAKRRRAPSTAVVGVRADNTTVLLGVILLVGIVTVAQYFAAHFSHSLALFADAIQNTVDLSTYIVNFYVEYIVIHNSGSNSATRVVRLNIAAAIFSLVGLLVVGFYVLSSALHRISRPNDIDSAAIDSTLLLVFTIVGLFCDIGTMIIFCVFAETKDASSRTNVNMASAMAHIYTDFVRSVLVTIGAIIIHLEQQKVLLWGVKEDKLDAVLSMVIVACIFTASFFLLKEIIHLINHGDHRLPISCELQQRD